jgi:hypothetical protein
VAITGAARNQLEVVGEGVDAIKLVAKLRRKIGHAEIFKVEKIPKDTKPKDNATASAVAAQQLPNSPYSSWPSQPFVDYAYRSDYDGYAYYRSDNGVCAYKYEGKNECSLM